MSSDVVVVRCQQPSSGVSEHQQVSSADVRFLTNRAIMVPTGDIIAKIPSQGRDLRFLTNNSWDTGSCVTRKAEEGTACLSTFRSGHLVRGRRMFIDLHQNVCPYNINLHAMKTVGVNSCHQVSSKFCRRQGPSVNRLPSVNRCCRGFVRCRRAVTGCVALPGINRFSHRLYTVFNSCHHRISRCHQVLIHPARQLEL